MDRWRRFYKWNKTKHADLLDFLWRHFDAANFSIFCATYRSQDLLFAPYQGDNVIHGLCSRIEAAGYANEVFGIMHTMQSMYKEEFKVLGFFIVPGQEMPSGLLAKVPDLSHAEGQFQLLKADTKDPLVRQFVGGLVTGRSPTPDYSVVFTRELEVPPPGGPPSLPLLPAVADLPRR